MSATKAQIEAANWALAHSWHADLGLTFAGIDLGDLATYSLLSVLGRIELNSAQAVPLPAPAEGTADGH